jgi:hypothetical protein
MPVVAEGCNLLCMHSSVLQLAIFIHFGATEACEAKQANCVNWQSMVENKNLTL